jgi:hypothetical protein
MSCSRLHDTAEQCPECKLSTIIETLRLLDPPIQRCDAVPRVVHIPEKPLGSRVQRDELVEHRLDRREPRRDGDREDHTPLDLPVEDPTEFHDATDKSLGQRSQRAGARGVTSRQ